MTFPSSIADLKRREPSAILVTDPSRQVLVDGTELTVGFTETSNARRGPGTQPTELMRAHLLRTGNDAAQQ